MRQTTIRKLLELNVCSFAAFAMSKPSMAVAWNTCERGDLMFDLLVELKGGEVGSRARKKLVLTVCQCARLILQYVPDGEDTPRIAIETTEAHYNGDATLDQVKNAYSAVFADYPKPAHYQYAVYPDYATCAAYAASAAYEDAGPGVRAAINAALYATAAADRKDTLKKFADIVRENYPNPPRF